VPYVLRTPARLTAGVRPYMHVAVCLFIAFLHALLAAAFTGVAFDAETPVHVSLGFGSLAIAMWLATGLLVACLVIPLPKLSVTIFRAWCIALPAVYFVGSMDSGTLTGQEFLLGIFVAVLSLATWRTFLWAKLPRRLTARASTSGA